MPLTKRDKAILKGLFLSKFDKTALESFDFTSFKEAFNVFGYSVETPPSSIKIIVTNLTHFSQITERVGITVHLGTIVVRL